MSLQTAIKAIFFLVFLNSCLLAQIRVSKNYSTKNGLANNTVYEVFNDSKGTVWVGTENGISKISNGLITNYDSNDGFAADDCRDIIEDLDKQLWFGSHEGGLTCFDGKRCYIINEKTGLINNSIRRLFLKNSKLYVGTEYGLSIIDVKTKKILFNAKITGVREKFQVMDFFEYKGEVYFGTYNDGVWKVDFRKKKIYKLFNKTDTFSMFTDDSKIIFCNGDTRDSSLLIQPLNSFLNNEKSQNRFGSFIIWNYVKLKNGRIFCTGNNINTNAGGLFEIKGNRLIDITKNIGITSTQLWSLHLDENRNFLYVSSLDKGIFEVDLRDDIRYYPIGLENENELIDIKTIEGKRILVTKKYIQIGKKLVLIKSLYKFFKEKEPYAEKTPEYFLFIRHKLEDSQIDFIEIINNQIWVNTSFGLFQLNNNGEIKKYLSLDLTNFYLLNKNKMIFQYSHSNFSRAIFSDKRIEYMKRYVHFPENIIQIFRYKTDVLLVSEKNGIFKFKNNSFQKIQSIKNKLIKCVQKNEDEIILGFSDGNVSVYNLKTKRIKSFENNALTGRNIKFIATSEKLIVIGTEKGIFSLNQKSISRINNRFLPSSDVFTNGDFQGGNLILIAPKGYYKVKYKSFLKSNGISKLSLTSIHSIHKKEEFYKGKTCVKIPKSKNQVQLQFEPINSAYPENLKFRYRIKSLNPNWNNWQKSNEINLSFLPNGEHLIEMQVLNEVTNQSKIVKLVTIAVIPPFYQQYWFLAISVLLVLLLSLGFIRRRLQKKHLSEKNKIELEKRIAETKLQALQSQMNPHFVFNAMNSIQNFVIDSKTDDALWYIGEFSKLMRQTLDFSSRQYIRLEEEIDYLKRYIQLENLRRNVPVKYSIDIAESIDIHEIEIPPMLIEPIIENVFVHAFDAQIKEPSIIIRINLRDDNIVCEISDNGKGIDSKTISQKKDSKGIHLIDERIQLITGINHKLVNIQQNSIGGTNVTLVIPTR